MITLLRKFFLENWQRKLISLILAIVTWMAINHSATITKTFSDIPIKVLNIPMGKTIEGLHSDGTLSKKISLTLSGYSNIINELSENDLMVVLDAKDKGIHWIPSITKKNLVSLNPEIDIHQGIRKIFHHEFSIHLSNLITEKIPIMITYPIGDAPKGFQFLNVWPYVLYITVSGPESLVKQLKAKGLKLTFNLNDINENDLQLDSTNKEEAHFFVPSLWKKVIIPSLSDTPLDIDDPQAQVLHIDFVHKSALPLDAQIPVTLYFSPKYKETLNPDTYFLETSPFITKKNGIFSINSPLFVKGVSSLFLDIVKERIEIVIVVAPKTEKQFLSWSVDFIFPSELEDRYVAKVLSLYPEETKSAHPELQEEYLRNRFRSYMNAFRLYQKENEKLSLKIEQQANTITVIPQPCPPKATCP
ncbi:MAG: hypothetical protein WCP39_00370 [Chlamydiota bacterium]